MPSWYATDTIYHSNLMLLNCCSQCLFLLFSQQCCSQCSCSLRDVVFNVARVFSSGAKLSCSSSLSSGAVNALVFLFSKKWYSQSFVAFIFSAVVQLMLLLS